jgi:predicted phosphodiesterase
MIWFAGDVHGQFEHIARTIDAASVKPAAIILLGDMEAPIPLHKCMRDVESRGVAWYWIIGNHDTDSQENFSNISDPMSMSHNIDGRVISIDGVRVAGLGGVLRGEIWYPVDGAGRSETSGFRSYEDYKRSSQEYRRLKARLSKRDVIQTQAVPPESRQWQAQLLELSRNGKLLKHRSTIFPDVYDRMLSMRADILVTHEAPSCHPHGFAVIDELARAMGVKRLFHGHHHDARDYSGQFEPMGLHSYGVGFRGITDLHGKPVRIGDFDVQRSRR